MTTHACPNCGSPSAPSIEARDYNRRIGSEGFTYYRCPACRLLFLDPLPDDLGEYYPKDYYDFAPGGEEARTRAENERYKLDIVKRFADGGSLVEIGPGNGGFSWLAVHEGFRVRAIEMSPESCEFLGREMGVETICTADEVAALDAGEPANVIALWHVIEHVVDPFELVRAAARKLLPGGVLVIAAPNPDALQFKLLGKRWVHLDAPRHVRLIPASVLRSTAEGAGLRTVMQTTTDDGSLGWNVYGWAVSFENLFRGERSRELAAGVGRRLSRLLRGLEGREGVGSAYTMVFEREA